MDIHETQAQIDKAYTAGKAAYFRDVGTHGPTLKLPAVKTYTPNPYSHDHGKQRLAWERGYHQNTKRVIAAAAAERKP